MKADIKDIVVKPFVPCIVIGHCKKYPGAISKLMGSEFDYNTSLSNRFTGKHDIFFYSNRIQYEYTNTIINEMAPRTKDYDLGLELHFNAFSKESANGCEALYWHTNKKAKMIAQYFCDQVELRLGIKSRGPKAISNNTQRGFAAFAYQEPTYLILEPGFGTNLHDSKILSTIAGKDLLSEIIEDVILYAKSIIYE